MAAEGGDDPGLARKMNPLPWSRAISSVQRVAMTFSELVRLLRGRGFALVRMNGSKRFYGKPGYPGLIQVDFHGKKEVPSGTLRKILHDAGIDRG